MYYHPSTQIRVMYTKKNMKVNPSSRRGFGFSFGKQGGIMDYKANIPIYLQVIDDIKKRILTGEIKLGDKLPSTRELAVQYTM